MPQTIIERVAKAIDPGAWISFPEDDYPAEIRRKETRKTVALDQARAAIQEMRDTEPTAAMKAAMWSLSFSNTNDSFTECWKAMLDAALNEQEAP